VHLGALDVEALSCPNGSATDDGEDDSGDPYESEVVADEEAGRGKGGGQQARRFDPPKWSSPCRISAYHLDQPQLAAETTLSNTVNDESNESSNAKDEEEAEGHQKTSLEPWRGCRHDQRRDDREPVEIRVHAIWWWW